MSVSVIRRVSMSDVAAHANVSHQTVSRVINGHSNVKDSTRRRVQQSINQLGYTPNGAARALASSRSRTIGLVAAGTQLHGPVSTLVQVEQAIRAAGYYLSVLTYPRITPQALRDARDHFTGQSVEGVIVLAATNDVMALLPHLSGSTPLIVVSSGEGLTGACSVGIDQQAGIDALMGLLEAEGHRRIAFVAGPAGNYDADARLEAWRAALKNRGLPVPPVYLGGWNAADGYAAGQDVARTVHAASSSAPTAVVAANDHMALGVMFACVEAGLRVPQDISVVGFDDVPGAAYFSPPLTTVLQPFDRLAEATVRGLVDAIGGQDPGNYRLPPVLITRASHGPVRTW